jgi:hypothetical protein
MSVAFHLGEVLIAYAVDGAFEAAPELERRACWLDMVVEIHVHVLLLIQDVSLDADAGFLCGMANI